MSGFKIKKDKKPNSKRGTIKTKLIAIPIVLVLIAITVIGTISSYTMRRSLLNEVERSGHETAEIFLNNMEKNLEFLDNIERMLEDKLKTAGRTILRNESDLSNDYMKALASDSDIDQLSWFDTNGVVQYANIDGYIGWVAPEGHEMDVFLKGDSQELIDEIRPDEGSGDYFKYGSFKNPHGTYVQVELQQIGFRN